MTESEKDIENKSVCVCHLILSHACTFFLITACTLDLTYLISIFIITNIEAKNVIVFFASPFGQLFSVLRIKLG